VADQFIKTGMYKNILVVGAEKHSFGLDFSTREEISPSSLVMVPASWYYNPLILQQAQDRTREYSPHTCTVMERMRRYLLCSIPVHMPSLGKGSATGEF
jgi:hypothetical protein